MTGPAANVKPTKNGSTKASAGGWTKIFPGEVHSAGPVYTTQLGYSITFGAGVTPAAPGSAFATLVVSGIVVAHEYVVVVPLRQAAWCAALLFVAENGRT